MPRLTVEPQVQPLIFPSHQPPGGAVLTPRATAATGPRARGASGCVRGVISVRRLAPEVLHEPIIGVEPRPTVCASGSPAGNPLAVKRDRLLSHSLPDLLMRQASWLPNLFVSSAKAGRRKINGTQFHLCVSGLRNCLCLINQKREHTVPF